MPLVLGVDSSTQSTKVEIRDADDGRLVAFGRAPHPPVVGPRCEQPPEAWWRALADAQERLGHAAELLHHEQVRLVATAGADQVRLLLDQVDVREPDVAAFVGVGMVREEARDGLARVGHDAASAAELFDGQAYRTAVLGIRGLKGEKPVEAHP